MIAAEGGIMPATRFERITTDPKIMGGKPCIRGLRFPVSRLLGLLAAGQDEQSVLADYPYLEREDIHAALAYAAALAEEEVVELTR
jgi:uncharacterized protein (DUF433 family)